MNPISAIFSLAFIVSNVFLIFISTNEIMTTSAWLFMTVIAAFSTLQAASISSKDKNKWFTFFWTISAISFLIAVPYAIYAALIMKPNLIPSALILVSGVFGYAALISTTYTTSKIDK